MLCSLTRVMKELQEYTALGIPFIVKTPYIAYDENGHGMIAFEIFLHYHKGYPDKIVYETLTYDHYKHTKLLFPAFHR